MSAATAEPERTRLIHPGSSDLPPLVEVPGGMLPLQSVVKPPDVDVLSEWQQKYGNENADCSWGSVWPAAVNLAALIASTPSLVQGQRVCELGSGLGIPGLVAAAVGASTVTLIDREALALHCAMSTAAVCGLRTGPVPDDSAAATSFYATPSAGVVSASMADWGADPAEDLAFDVVLAAEVLYEPAAAMAFARSAERRLRKSGGTLLLADPADGRGSSMRTTVAEALEDMGASVSVLPLDAPPAGDGWYSLRAGDGKAGVAAPTEPVVLLRADFGRTT